MGFYDSRTVAAHFGINHRILMNWVKTGLVHPHDHYDHTGSRKAVLFSAEDVKEIARLIQVRKYLRGQSLRDVLNTLRVMGHNPLSQGDFLVLENQKGRRNVIKIMQNNEAIQLLHAQPDRQLRLIPLTGDDIKEAIPDPAPISLLFDLDQFTPVEIAEIIGLLSEIYQDVGGDALIIEDLTLLDPTSILVEV
jgi:hypothetical protein